MEKRKIKRVIYSKLKIGEDDDDDDELDDNDDRVYKDSGRNTIPTFKPNKDCASNRITEGSYDLNGLWEKEEILNQSLDSNDDENEKDRREADATLNVNFSNIESVVNKEHGLALEKKEEEDENFFQDIKWLFFVGGYSERTIKTREIFENRIHKLGLDL